MQVLCPTCKKSVEWSKDNPFRPFCCERCKLIDLGAWANGSYTISDQDGSAPVDPNSIHPDESED